MFRAMIERWYELATTHQYRYFGACADELVNEIPVWTLVGDEEIPHDYIFLAYRIAGTWVRTVIPAHQIPDDTHHIDYYWRPLCDLDTPRVRS